MPLFFTIRHHFKPGCVFVTHYFFTTTHSCHRYCNAMTSNTLPLHWLQDFLSLGSVSATPSPLQLHLLRGWRDTTLLSYNAAVRKFKRFLQASGNEVWTLPASPQDVYAFWLWAGRTEQGANDQDVTSNTLKKYLYGLQAWHSYHDLPYPHVTDGRVTVLLRACGRQDALKPARPLKAAVTLEHVLTLYHSWVDGSAEQQATLDCTIVAFWGMLRLAEVTYEARSGTPPWLNSLLCRDVVQTLPTSASVTLVIRGAKTAKAEVPQFLRLNAQPNILCPVKAIKRRLLLMTSPEDALFAYGDNDRTNLTRSRVVTLCTKVWIGQGWLGLSGHSFRVGGASLRAALGVPHDDIKQIGRWTSDCYKLYLRVYSPEVKARTLALLTYLNTE